MKDFYIRNYQPEDFNDFLALLCNGGPENADTGHITPQLLSENFNHPLRTPEKNIFLAVSSDKVIGFCEVYPEIQIHRALLDAMVHPDFRRQRVATALLEKALARSAALGAVRVHADILKQNGPARSFMEHNGFAKVREYLNMVLDLTVVDLETGCPSEFQIRPCETGEEKMLCEIQNYCFKESWGFKPNSEEEIRYLVNTSGCSPDDVIFCMSDNRPVGYCWTKISHVENELLRGKTGRIHMLGVDPAFRGSGLGRIALLEGIAQLKDKGVTIVELTTDSANPPAYELYQSVGFQHQSTVLWYEKELS